MEDFLMCQVLDDVQGTTGQQTKVTGSRLTLVKSFTWVLLLRREALGVVIRQILSCFTLVMREHGKRTKMEMAKKW